MITMSMISLSSNHLNWHSRLELNQLRICNLSLIKIKATNHFKLLKFKMPVSYVIMTKLILIFRRLKNVLRMSIIRKMKMNNKKKKMVTMCVTKTLKSLDSLREFKERLMQHLKDLLSRIRLSRLMHLLRHA